MYESRTACSSTRSTDRPSASRTSIFESSGDPRRAAPRADRPTPAGGSTTTPPDKTATWSPNKIYAEAKDEASSGAYDKAIPLYEKLEGRAAGTPLAQQAQLDKAHAQYKGGEQAQEGATLNRIRKLTPARPGTDQAL